jgi:glycosyltransferase involved in cell wall biosynthesis
MKVALIAPTYLPSRRANTVQVMKMAQALTAQGHTVWVTVSDPYVASSSASSSCDWSDLAYQYGLKHAFQVAWLPVNPRLRGYDYGLRAVRWARSWGAEVTYTRHLQAAALSSCLGRPTILEIHDLPRSMTARGLVRIFLSGKGARRLVLVSRALAGDLAQATGAPESSPFTVIAPDGVDLERYEGLSDPREARQVLPDIPDRFTAGYTGHLYPGRGIEMLLKMAARLPKITFLLVGGEPQDVERFRSQVQEMSLDNVIFTGYLPNAELPMYQAACEVLLMPYQQRVAASSGGDIAPYLSPMKLFEYLACGRVILSSDLPVLREVLSPENAILLPPDDVDAWVEAIRSVQNDLPRRQRLSLQAKLAARQYTWNERARRILDGLESYWPAD